MVEAKMLAKELAQARSARRAAEEACCAVEETLWEVERGPRYWRRIALSAPATEPAARPH